MLVLFQAGAASAGQIVFSSDFRPPGSNTAVNFENPSMLRAFHSELQSGQPDFYTFRANKGTFLKVKLYTARLVGQDNFQPSVALFGPGLPEPVPSELRRLAFSLPAGAGLLVSENEGRIVTVDRARYDEPWTQGSYWEGQNLLSELPQDGTYYLAVFSRDKQSGKYALAVGDKIEAGLRETLAFPVIWVRTHLWFNDLWWPLVALLVATLLLIGLVYLYLRMIWRQLKVIRLSLANTRRNALLEEKRIRRNWQKRRLAKTSRFRPVQPVIELATPVLVTEANTELVAANLSGSVELETPVEAGRVEEVLLTGPKWEIVAATTPLVVTPGNGHIKLNSNGHAQVNGLTAPANNLDGLSQWGQRLRPRATSERDEPPKPIEV